MKSAQKSLRAPFVPREDADARRREAVIRCEQALAPNSGIVLQLRDCLRAAIWAYTTADGKHDNCRYRSAAVLAGGAPVRFEHVVPINTLIDRLLARPERCEAILAEAVCCVVTLDQALALDRQGSEGWDRYDALGITVVDMTTLRER